ncbi:MAG: ATP-binding protein [Candidatus Riflebacteria bacterium]|nr:ATP-binding protein [Candidatus Riflebacteria bacterium]
MIERTIKPALLNSLFKGKAVVIYGARQVGKTTLMREVERAYAASSLYLNCDEPDVRHAMTEKTSTELKALIGRNKLVLIDEAQRVTNIGITLKLFVDAIPETQVIATGSSSFELSNKIVEPLTGRKIEFHLHPFSLEELKQVYSPLELGRLLETQLIFGMYPDVVNFSEAATNTLRELTRSYLYKDILAHNRIRHSDVLEKLLQSLALQIGSEVSYTELAQQTGVDKVTIESYIRMLEQAFVIFRLRPYSTNQRNELKKLRKIYFVDTGLRNMLINNLNPPDLRSDMGSLWENFVISERLKHNENHGRYPNTWFWRSHQQQEIDYLEEAGGALHGWEIKSGKGRFRVPAAFATAYPECRVSLITRDNLSDFVISAS